MNQEISTLIDELKKIIKDEFPLDKERDQILSFVDNLDKRFPGLSRTIRSLVEIVYEEKFNEKFL